MYGALPPHVLVNDSTFINGQSECPAEAIVIHFQEHFLGEDFLNTSEMETLKNFLKLSKRGLALYGNTKEQINALIMKGLVHMHSATFNPDFHF